MASEVGSGYVALLPSARNFRRNMEREIGGDLDAAGRSGGARYGRTFSDSTGRTLKSRFAAIGKIAGVGLLAGVAGVIAIKRAFGGFIADARESVKVSALTNQVLKSTGRVAGITAKGVTKLATAISRKTGIDDEAIQASENLLLTFTNVRNEVGKGNDIFSRATGLVQDMSVALGQDAKSGAIQLGKALNDPVKGITALSRVGVSFTAQQKDQIKTLVESGRTLDAQKIILKELGREFGGAAAAAATPTQKLAVTMGNLKESLGGALLPLIDRGATLLDGFVRGFQDGEGAGGRFRDVLTGIRDGVQGLVDRLKGAKWKQLAGRVVAGITAGLRGGAALWGKVKPNLTAFGTALFDGAKKTAQQLINGLQVGVATGDWGPLGQAVADGIGRAASGAGSLTKAIGNLLAGVDWFALGKTAAAAAVPFTISFVNNLAGAFLTTAKDHPLDVAAFILAVIPIGRIAGLLGKVFGKLPIAGPLLRGIETVGSAIEGPVVRFLVKPFGRAIGFIGRELLNGFRLVFPRAGAALSRELGLIGTRIGLFGVKLAELGKRLVTRLVGGVASQLNAVGAQAALIVARILRPFAKAGTFLLQVGRDIVSGLVRGIRGGFGAVVQAAKDLAGTLPGWVKKIWRIGSPSKVMQGLGLFGGLGLVLGLKDAKKPVADAARDMAQSALDAVSERLDRIKDRISTFRSDLQSLKSSVRDAVTGTLDVGSLRGGLGAMFDIKALASKAGAFVKALGNLARKGVAPGLIELIAQAGPEQGLLAAQSIGAESRSQIKSTNADFNRLGRFANQAARIAGDVSGLPEQIAELKEIKAGIHTLVRKRTADLNVTIDLGEGSVPKTVRRKKLAAAF